MFAPWFGKDPLTKAFQFRVLQSLVKFKVDVNTVHSEIEVFF